MDHQPKKRQKVTNFQSSPNPVLWMDLFLAKYFPNPLGDNKDTKDFCFKYILGEMIYSSEDTHIINAQKASEHTQLVIKFLHDRGTFENERYFLQQLEGKHHTIEMLDSFEFISRSCYGFIFRKYIFDVIEFPSSLDIKKYMFMLLEALEYLHDDCIIHRDVKPENIGITYDASGIIDLVLGDFGIAESTFNEEWSPYGQRSGTLNYMPKECLNSGGPEYSETVDIWAAGVVFIQLILNTDVVFSGNSMGAVRGQIEDFAEDRHGWLQKKRQN